MADDNDNTATKPASTTVAEAPARTINTGEDSQSTAEGSQQEAEGSQKDAEGSQQDAEGSAKTPESSQPPVEPPKAPVQVGRGKAGRFFAFLFNLILLGGIGFIGYLVYEQDKAVAVLFDQQNGFLQQRDDLINSTNTRISSMQDSVEELQAALAAAREEAAALVAQQAGEIERLQNELVSTRLRINNTNPGASQEWLVAEAASLLRLARQHLVVARNIRTAQALYLAADDVLKQIDEPAIFAVREMLAGELAAIRAVNEVDVSSLYLQLGAIADQINSLQVTNDLASQVASGEQVSLGAGQQAEAEGMLSRFFARLRTSLNNYFVVRRRDAPIQPLLTPGQEAALMQTIRLQIEQGRTALLKGEQAIYSTSLEQARNTIAAYLAGDAGVRDSVLSTLDDLRARRIVTEVPPLNRSLQALDQILATPDSGTTTPDGA